MEPSWKSDAIPTSNDCSVRSGYKTTYQSRPATTSSTTTSCHIRQATQETCLQCQIGRWRFLRRPEGHLYSGWNGPSRISYAVFCLERKRQYPAALRKLQDGPA